ncbi:25809_t:CDS:2, partial [Racocetra persica]
GAEIEPESDEKIIIDYSAPDIENGDEEEFEHIDNLDNSFGWILIWILRYQQRYWLPDIATESLVKFIHFLLTDFNQDQFKNFPKSLYLAKKLMSLEYPNHTISKIRQPCNQQLAKEVPTKDGILFRPLLTYQP